MAGIFGNYRALMASIAQIILVVIFLPMLCFVLSLFGGSESAFSMITNLLSELPFMEYWFDVLMQMQEGTVNLSAVDIYNTSIAYANTAILEATVIGMTVSLCKMIGVLLDFRGLPIIQSVMGVFFGCVLLRIFRTDNWTSLLYLSAILIVVNIVVIWVVPSITSKFKKILGTLFGLGMQIVIAVLSAGYLILLTLILNGTITELRIVLIVLAVLFLPLLIMISIDFFLLTPKNERFKLF